MANPTSNFGWQMPTPTDLVTDLPADFEVFGQAVDTSMADLKGGTTDQVLAKNSNTDMDFKWVTSDDANAIQNAIVDAKGDLIAASANDTPARLAVGNDGETLVADSSATTGLSYQSNYAAGKNAVINGAFNVWQRGTTFTNPAGDSYTADRFMIDYGTAAPTSNSVTRQTFTPGTAPVAGYEGAFFFRSTLTTVGTTSRLSIHHKIENVQTYAGQTVTLSFFAKADSARSLGGFIQQNFGSGGSTTVSTAITTQSVTTAWTRFSMQVTVPSISGKTIGTSSFLNIRLDQAVAAGSVLELWGLQLEAGSVVTAFQTATGTLQGELAACQRYYYEKGGDALYEYHTIQANSSTTESFSILTLPVQMRVTPSASVSAAGDFASTSSTGSTITCTAVTFQSSGAKSLGIKTTVASGLVAGNSSLFLSNNTTSARIKASAEL
jgi:hypothetical protein